MERDQVVRWLNDYIDAWRGSDRGRIEALFTDDAAYRYHPWEDPVTGAAEIASSWLAAPDVPSTWDATYAPVAVDGDTAVAVGTSRYAATEDHPARTYHNCFVMRFADDGRCRMFTEWYMQEPA